MAKQYYSVLTTYGAQLFAQAMANKRPVTITHMAVGDGNGKSIQPDSTRATLFREVHRTTVSAVSTDPRNNKQVIFELTIPEAVGGFYIREMGIFDATGKMVAMANCPETYKPRLDEGSGKVQVLRMVLLVSSSDAVTITVDDTVIFATRGQLTPKTLTGTSTNAVNETGHTHEITKASTTQAGLVQLTNDTGLDSEVLALTAKAGKALAQSIAQAKLDTTNGLNKKVDKTNISDAVNSTSQTTVASSRAVKTAYDKGVEAKTLAEAAYQVNKINQNQNLNNLLGQNTVFGTSGRTDSVTGLGGIYNYGVGLAISASGANAIIYVPHSSANTNNGVWVQSNFVGNPTEAAWMRIDGADFAGIRNNPLSVSGMALKYSGQYISTHTNNGEYGGLEVTRSGTHGSWISRLEALPDRRWKFWTNSDHNGYEQFIKAENGTFAFLSDITKALAAYIPNSQKSNAVDSSSTDTVATSRAVKLAYDRANTANNNADGRVPKAGGTMTGNLVIRAGDYSSVRTYNTAGFGVRWESAPSTSNNMAAIVLADTEEIPKYRFLIPKQNGTAAIDGDVVHLAGNEVITGEKTFHHQIKLRSNADNSKLGRMGQNTNDLFIQNGYSGKTLQLKNTGELRYNDNLIHDDSMPYVGMTVKDSAYGGIDISRSGTSGTWASRIEALPDKRWKFHVQNSHDIYFPVKSGTVVLDSDCSNAGGANKVVKTDGSGDVIGRLFRATYQDEARIQGAIAFRVNNSNDNYTRYCNSPSAVRTWLGLHESATRAANWEEVSGKPSTFTPSTHNHPWNQVTGIPATATRWPTWSEVTNKPTLVQDIRLGATVRRKLEDAAWETYGAGYVVTGFHNVSADLNTNDYVYVKPIQKYINGAWVTIANA